jgi:cytochrome c-type biogenesis protein CcmE
MSMGRMKFILGTLFILAAVTFIIFSATEQNAEYFMTVDEVQAKGQHITGQSLRLSGAVIGDTIQYDPQTLTLTFEVAQVPGSNNEIAAEGGLAEVLHAAVADPNRARLKVVYVGPRPDLLKNEAQAIMTGHMESDGTFVADELLLKCPTKYQEAVPSQAASG